MNHIYWDDLEEYNKSKAQEAKPSNGAPEPECSVM